MQDEITGECLRFQKVSMKKAAAAKTVRKPRSDARRNRERILEVARQVFTRRGAAASMDEITKRAKIGPGTLYRHFPTPDELQATVYITEVEKLAAAQKKLSAELSPIQSPPKASRDRFTSRLSPGFSGFLAIWRRNASLGTSTSERSSRR